VAEFFPAALLYPPPDFGFAGFLGSRRLAPDALCDALALFADARWAAGSG
jgi:hypothetical protein